MVNLYRFLQRSILIGLSLGGLLWSSNVECAAADDASLEAKGRIVTRVNGTLQAVGPVQVDLLTIDDQLFAQSSANLNGFFHIKTSFKIIKPVKLWVRVVYDDGRFRLPGPPRVRLQNREGNILGQDLKHAAKFTRPLPNTIFGGGSSWIADLGDLEVDVGAKLAYSGLWKTAFDAYEDYRSIMGGEHPRSGKVDIDLGSANAGYPWSNVDTIHWPGDYDDYGAVRHEFGHIIRHSLDGDNAHFANDLVRFKYAQAHNPCSIVNEGFSFNEGWALFWEGAIAGCTMGGDGSFDQMEADVALKLGRLARRPGVGRKGLVEVLRRNWEKVHSYGEFERRYRNIFRHHEQEPASAMWHLASGALKPVMNIG